MGRLVFRRIYERPLVPPLNEVRTRLGLSPVTSLSDLLVRADRIFEGRPDVPEDPSIRLIQLDT
jgi:hypothetical protein